jgi:hypothetical protein
MGEHLSVSTYLGTMNLVTNTELQNCGRECSDLKPMEYPISFFLDMPGTPWKFLMKSSLNKCKMG